MRISEKTKEFNNVVLIQDISKYTQAQIDEVISRSKQYDNLFGECLCEPSEFWDIRRASHIVYNLRIQHNSLIGDLKTLATEFGNVLYNISETCDILQYIQPSIYDTIIRTFHFVVQPVYDKDK